MNKSTEKVVTNDCEEGHALQTRASKGDFYDDYLKFVSSNNTYETWVNTPENLEKFYQALNQYHKAHLNANEVKNPNCPDCPKYPIISDAFWDKDGRNWVFTDKKKWKDLSGEFCDAGCNNDWKKGYDVQEIHQQFYEEELKLRENDPLQARLGGINDEFRENLKRMTQFATVTFLKEYWVNKQVGWEKWVPILGNVLKANANIKVSNGDMTFYTKAAGNIAMAATDAAILKRIVQSTITVAVETGATTAVKTIVTEEVSLLKLYFSNYGKKLLTGLLISGSTQILPNYIVYDDFKTSVSQLDAFDMFVDGMTYKFTLPLGIFYKLFKNGEKLCVYYTPVGDKIARVIVLNFAKASIDFKLADIEIKSLFNNQKESFDVLTEFVLRVGADITAEKILNILIGWNNADLETSKLIKDYFTPERKELANKIDAILRSDGFTEDIKTGGKVIRKYLQVVLHDNNVVNVEAEVDKINNTELSLEDIIKKELSLPKDNTNINQYIVHP